MSKKRGKNPPPQGEKKAPERHVKVACRNPTAYKDYVLEDKFEAGMVLSGSEVKSLRDGGASLKEAYVTVDRGEAWLVNANIAPYKSASVFNHEPKRRRKLLLHKRQILRLHGRLTQEGMTIVPLQIYFLNGKAKLELAVGKGRRQYDRREQIRKKEERREIEKVMKAKTRYRGE
ncbi:MAG: SsrA-binding protein SmpB [Deltaproteobacteria bacterium]|nr:SsrA-binding protein SmpB [Deltaproteobacteria bacterium]